MNPPSEVRLSRTSVLLLSVCGFAIVALGAGVVLADGIPLKLDRGAVTVGEWSPMGVGVPLKEGMVKDPRCVGIVSRSRGALPVQCEVRTRYPDSSVQWLWADFYGPAEESFNLVVNAAPAPATMDVQAIKQPRSVSVASGALQVTWDAQFATPVKVEGVAAKGARGTLAEGDGAGIYLVDDKGGRAVLGGLEAELDFRVETANSLRAVSRRSRRGSWQR
jgi:hypothetical protein